MGQLSRRSFLRTSLRAYTGLASLPFVGGMASCDRQSTPRSFQIPGDFVNPTSASRGHLLRDRLDPSDFEPAEAEEWDAIVLGGGMSGLAAMWKLKQAGVTRILLLELEAELGGTSAWHDSADQSFPWGAHYINIPPREADCIHELLLDLGVIVGYDAAFRPQVNPQHRLKWPRERLHVDGGWIEDLDPIAYGSARDRESYLAFEDDMLRWMLYRGKDGRRALAMPLAYSSSDSEVRELDQMSMFEYVRLKGWADSAALDWFVNYACRDDYGSLMHQVSAWAGIHYFACRDYDRRLSSEYPTDTLTWDEGNGYLVKRMARGLESSEVRLSTAVVGIHADDGGAQSVACVDLTTSERYRLTARNVIYAGKLHAAPYVIRDLTGVQERAFRSLEYSPWLVAAVHVDGLPDGDVPLAWDNVTHGSPALGYINASHQSSHSKPTDPAALDVGISERESGVLVYYYPFVEKLRSARRKLLTAGHGHWVNVIMNDLTAVHPDLEDLVGHIDIRRWGHAMVRPSPGLLWGAHAESRRVPHGSLSFASCDAGGLPLFEEAVFAGIRAAEECLHRLGAKFETSLMGMGHVEAG